MEDKKLRKKLGKRVSGGLVDSQAQKRLCREHNLRVEASLEVADNRESISSHEFRNFLLSCFVGSPAPSVLRLCNSAAVNRVVLLLTSGVHPTAISDEATLEQYPNLMRLDALKPVSLFEGERPSSLLEALLYSKRDRGSAQSVRKRRRAITLSEEQIPYMMKLPPLEHYIATPEQLEFHGYAFAKLAVPDGSDGLRVLHDVTGAEGDRTQTPMIRSSETDRLNLLLPVDDAQKVVESFGEVEGYCFTNGDQNGDHARGPKVFAMDCEMVETAVGFELARLSVVQYLGEATEMALKANSSSEELKSTSKDRPRPQKEPGVATVTELDIFVLPENPVQNYLTKYSGITKDILDGTHVTFVQARAAILRLLMHQDILVGHSLENDLKCLRVAHKRVVDTSIIFAHPQGPPRRASLKWLSKTYLDIRIHADEQNGHDSIEDARTALSLAVLKVENGPQFGLNLATFNKQSLAQLISCHSLQQKNEEAKDDEPPRRTVWISHVTSLAFHVRPGVAGISFPDFQVHSVRSAFEKALETSGFRDLVVMPIDVEQLLAQNGTVDRQVGEASKDPGISEAKVAALLSQGLAPRTLEALDTVVAELEEALKVKHAESRCHGDDKTLVLLLAQVDVKPILSALKQKQACSSVRSASIWSPRQQKLLKAMTEAARTGAIRFSFC